MEASWTRVNAFAGSGAQASRHASARSARRRPPEPSFALGVLRNRSNRGNVNKLRLRGLWRAPAGRSRGSVGWTRCDKLRRVARLCGWSDSVQAFDDVKALDFDVFGTV